MTEFKEISIQEIAEYKDPFSLFADWAAASAKGKEKANSLLIGWGGLGILWSKPCCTVYIHESRYSKKIFDEADSFSVWPVRAAVALTYMPVEGHLQAWSCWIHSPPSPNISPSPRNRPLSYMAYTRKGCLNGS